MIRVSVLSLLLFCCVIYETYSVTLSSNHFRCADGSYIYDSWFCDGSIECRKDGSDESYGCDRKICGRGKFKCTDGTCLNITVRCNNLNDCTDGSDERNCGDEIDIEDCPSREGSFLCEDQSKCIDFENNCDGYCNCLDCSDETAGCRKYDDYVCEKCSDTCYSTTPEAHKFSTAPSLNISLTPCKVCRYSFSCEHKCLQIEQFKERCLCDENYEMNDLDEDGEVTCWNSVSHENVIIYSTSNEVKLFNLTTNQTIILRSGIDCTALSAAHDNVYYAVFANNLYTIFKTSISSKNTQTVITSDSMILSIAIDWITNNIYYTTDTSIIVCSNDGRTCTELRSCSECRVKLAPKLGLMFWSENEILFQSAMDGLDESNFSNLLTTHSLYGFNHSRFLFAVDELSDRVFWSSNLPLISRARLYSDFKNEYVILSLKNKRFGEFFDLDEFENDIFFTFENSNEIYFLTNPIYYSLARVTDNSTSYIKYIHVYNRLLQRTKIPNPCANSTCSLCLLRPFTPFIGLNYVCKQCENAASANGYVSCNDQTGEKSKIIPDATARKRDFNDVNNPPWTLGNFLRKIKTWIIIIIVMIIFSAGVYFASRKWNMIKNHRTRSVRFFANPNK